uniref:Putative secreted protein n=1 Tax=Ixodes ricinus TaxID=34613 RepID=A0A6B0U3K5_IXORI
MGHPWKDSLLLVFFSLPSRRTQQQPSSLISLPRHLHENTPFSPTRRCAGNIAVLREAGRGRKTDGRTTTDGRSM